MYDSGSNIHEEGFNHILAQSKKLLVASPITYSVYLQLISLL